MNILKFQGKMNCANVAMQENEMHDLTFEAVQMVLRIAAKMYEIELDPKIYYSWDAIMNIAKSIESANKGL